MKPAGLGGEVLRTRRTLVVNTNMEAEARRLGAYSLATSGRMAKSQLVVPLLLGGEVTGMIDLHDSDNENSFSEADVRLLETIAASMSVALENARLFDETQRRTREAAALAEVGRDLSSTLDLATVMDRIAHHARDLLRADTSAIFLPGEQPGAHRAIVAVGDGAEQVKATVVELGHGIIGSLIASGTAEAVNDTAHDPRGVQIAGTTDRAEERLMVAPLLAEDVAKGAIAVWRSGAQRFDEQDLQFLVGLSRQAAVALRNAQLFDETHEALERQTATAEILKVISESPTNVQPVFDAIAERARVLCAAAASGVARFDGTMVHLVAYHGISPEADTAMRSAFPMRPGAGTASARCIQERAPVQFHDVLNDPAYEAKSAAAQAGFRSNMAVPMLREGQVVGAIVVCRAEPGVFPDEQVALLQTFADQAVIAIENVRLFNETREALERQTATSEVLQVISESPTSVQPVFDAIAQRARRLCNARMSGVALYDGKLVHMEAYDGATEMVRSQMLTKFPRPVDRQTMITRTIAEGRPVQLPDCLADPEYIFKDASRAAGIRSYLGVPMVREGRVIGAMSVARAEPGLFPDEQVQLLQTFADQAVIAIENVRLFNETREALERQTATAEILRVISSSPTDVQPVFDAIVHSCQRLFRDARVGLTLREGDTLVTRAHAGREAPGRLREVVTPWPLDHDSASGSCILDARVIAIADLSASSDEYPRMRDMGVAMGFGSGLFVPLLREGGAIGSINIFRVAKGAFEAKELALAQTFADQAVIAIQNVRLFRETQEALERQLATGEILASMSGSMADTTPVFDAIARNLLRLFDTQFALVALARDGQVEIGAFHGTPGSEKLIESYPRPIDDQTHVGRTILRGEVSQIVPIVGNPAVPPLTAEFGRRFGYDAQIGAPMVRAGKVIGAIVTARREARPFDDKQVALITAFADQAVIAIENVRLFNETREALDHRTATSDVLQVISQSMSDASPVFDKILDSCERLFGASDLGVFLVSGTDQLEAAAYRGSFAAVVGDNYPRPLAGTMSDMVIRHGAVRHWPDVDQAGDVPEYIRASVQAGGNFSVAVAPLMWAGRGIGTLDVMRKPPRPYTDKELALLATFADQAVIAIQNARLFNDTREALERQQASAEILSVISSSVADTAPVFDKILQSCKHLFGSDETAVLLVDEQNQVRLGAYVGRQRDAVAATFPAPLQKSPAWHAIQQRRTVEFRDAANNPKLTRAVRRVAQQIGYRSMAYAPMLWDGRGIGAIGVSRIKGEFRANELDMLQTFADQAVIAIQNARLFNETREALERQTATAEVLQVISSSVADTAPVFEKILDSCQHLFATEQLGIFLVDEAQQAHMAAWRGSALAAIARTFPRPVEQSMTARVIAQRSALHLPDAAAIAEAPPTVLSVLQLIGNFSAVWAPLLWEERGIGSICVLRQPPLPFAEREIALLKTFADQAVIADTERAAVQAGAGGARRRRDGQRGQERVPGDDEPRDPHADERGHRHERPAARHAAQRRAARLRQHDPRLGRRAADDHQRHPRLLEDRGRAHGHRGAAVRPARVRGVGARPDRGARGREAPRPGLRVRGRRAGAPSSAT